MFLLAAALVIESLQPVRTLEVRGLYEGETFTLAELVLGEREGKGRAVRK